MAKQNPKRKRAGRESDHAGVTDWAGLLALQSGSARVHATSPRALAPGFCKARSGATYPGKSGAAIACAGRRPPLGGLS